METTVNIPAVQKTQKINQFRFVPGSHIAAVGVRNDDDGSRFIEVDFQELINAATPTQIGVLKQFFKRIAALALDNLNKDVGVDVTEDDVDGDLFE